MKKITFLLSAILFCGFLSAQTVEWYRPYLYPAFTTPFPIVELPNGDFLTASGTKGKSAIYTNWNLLRVNSKGDSLRSWTHPGLFEFPLAIDISDTNAVSCNTYDYWEPDTLIIAAAAFYANGKTGMAGTKKLNIDSIKKPDNILRISSENGKGYPGFVFHSSRNGFQIFYCDTSGKLLWLKDRTDSNSTEYGSHVLSRCGKTYLLAYSQSKQDKNKKSYSRLCFETLDSMGNTLKTKVYDSIGFSPDFARGYKNSYYLGGHCLRKIMAQVGDSSTNYLSQYSSFPSVLKLDSNLDSVYWAKVAIGPDSAVYSYELMSDYGNFLNYFDVGKDGTAGLVWRCNYLKSKTFKHSEFFTVIDDKGNIKWTKIIDEIGGKKQYLYTSTFIFTSDNGYLLTGFSLNGRYPWLIKLSNTITGITDKAGIPPGNLGLFPNPAAQSITVHTGEGNSTEMSLDIYNLQGQEVQNYTHITASEITILRHGLPSGMYFLKLQDKEGKIYTGKVVWE